MYKVYTRLNNTVLQCTAIECHSEHAEVNLPPLVGDRKSLIDM